MHIVRRPARTLATFIAALVVIALGGAAPAAAVPQDQWGTFYVHVLQFWAPPTGDVEIPVEIELKGPDGVHEGATVEMFVPGGDRTTVTIAANGRGRGSLTFADGQSSFMPQATVLPHEGMATPTAVASTTIERSGVATSLVAYGSSWGTGESERQLEAGHRDDRQAHTYIEARLHLTAQTSLGTIVRGPDDVRWDAVRGEYFWDMPEERVVGTYSYTVEDRTNQWMSTSTYQVRPGNLEGTTFTFDPEFAPESGAVSVGLALELFDGFGNPFDVYQLYFDTVGGSCADVSGADASEWTTTCSLDASADVLDITAHAEAGAMIVGSVSMRYERVGSVERTATLELAESDVVASGSGTVGVTFTVTDGGRGRGPAPATGLAPRLEVDGVRQAGTLAETAPGVYEGTVPVTRALGDVAVRATSGDLSASAMFTQVVGEPANVALAVAEVGAHDAAAAAAATTTWQVTATVEDAYGHRLAGHPPVLTFVPAQDHDALTDHGDGTYTTRVRATSAFTVTATVGTHTATETIDTTPDENEGPDDEDEGPGDEDEGPGDEDEGSNDDELAATGPVGTEGIAGLALATTLLGAMLVSARHVGSRRRA